MQFHKWNSSRAQLEDVPVIKQADRSNQTYAKQQLGCDKNRDVISVSIPEKTVETKRGILRFLASIFHPLAIVSPVALCGKILYRKVYDLEIGWE